MRGGYALARPTFRDDLRAPMACLDDDTAALFAHGALDPERTAAARAHVAECARCDALLVEIARLATGASRETGRLEPSAHDREPRYVILRALGAGGMGVVFAAHDRQLDRTVALKLLRTGAEGALLDEARALARVSHPNVVQVHDVVRAAGSCFVTMELVEGSSLRAWREREAPAPPRVLEVMLAAGEGLAAIHAAGLVHRDLKPDNVLVGSDGRARVADLGLAVASSGAPHAQGGTPAYMAPEQLAGEPASARSDQWAFAATLCEALSGVRPFEGSTLEEVRADRARRRAPRLPRGSGLARALGPALRRALDPAPARRFESMRALLDALRRAARASGRAQRAAHVVVLSLLTLLHWAASAWQLQLFLREDHPATRYVRSSQPHDGDGAGVFALWLIFAVICSFAWNPLCAVLAPATVIGLVRRSAWSRWALAAYALLAIPFVLPIPYALFALVSVFSVSFRAELTR